MASQFKLVFYFQEAAVPPDPPEPPIYATAYWSNLVCVTVEAETISAKWEGLVCVTTTDDVVPPDMTAYWDGRVCVTEESMVFSAYWSGLVCVTEFQMDT